MRKMIRLATKAAYESKFRRARVGAVIVRGDRVLSVGCNRIGFSHLLPNRPYRESIHAEQQAILGLLKARRQHELIGATIYVSRIGRNGHERLSKPCGNCHLLCATVGIHKVVYTSDQGVMEYDL